MPVTFFIIFLLVEHLQPMAAKYYYLVLWLPTTKELNVIFSTHTLVYKCILYKFYSDCIKKFSYKYSFMYHNNRDSHIISLTSTWTRPKLEVFLMNCILRYSPCLQMLQEQSGYLFFCGQDNVGTNTLNIALAFICYLVFYEMFVYIF